MATISKHGTKWRVQIRPKGCKHISRSFDDIQTAKLWAAYKEDLLTKMQAFAPSVSEIITVKDAMIMKLESFPTYDSKRTSDLRRGGEFLGDYLNLPIGELTSELLLERADLFMKSLVRHGGSKVSGGTFKPPEFNTLHRRLAWISATYSHLQEKGINITNPVTPVLAIARGKYAKSDTQP